MARPGPRHAEPENLAVDGAADHGCNGLPLCADCQRQRPEPVKQDMPGFAAPPTGPNQVGKLASANTRPPTTRLGDSPALPTAPQSTSAAGIDRRQRAGTTQSQGSSKPRPGAWSTVCGWCASPIPTPAKPSRPLWSPTTKGRSASNTASPRPSRVIPASKLRPRTQNRAPRAALPKTETQAVLPQTRPIRPSTRSADRRMPDHVQRDPPTRSASPKPMLKDPVRCGGVAVWPVCAPERKGGGPWRAPLLCGVQAAVSYSPTPWRVQYHRRWQS